MYSCLEYCLIIFIVVLIRLKNKKSIRGMSFFVLIILIFLSVLSGYSGQEDEIQTDTSKDEITTRIYRSSDNLKITNQKKTFIDSVFLMDVINKNELLLMPAAIEFEEKPSNITEEIQTYRTNYFPWILSGVIIVVLGIIVFVLRRFKI